MTSFLVLVLLFALLAAGVRFFPSATALLASRVEFRMMNRSKLRLKSHPFLRVA